MALPRLEQRPDVLLYDFDGVIVDSVPLKTDAFVALYPGLTAAQHEQIRAYHRDHGGISRAHKIARYDAMYLDDERAGRADRIARYGELVEEAVCSCAAIDGAEAALAALAQKCRQYLVSGTPQSELRRIVGRRGYSVLFREIIGAPTEKTAAFADILAREGCGPAAALAIGDSRTEFEAARDLDIPFLGIVAAGLANPFPREVPVLPDLTRLQEVIFGRVAML